MRNFIAFIQRFRVLLVFALLQGIALSVYVTLSEYPKSQYLTSASAISGTVHSMSREVTKHFALDANNQALQKENIRLRALLKESGVPLSKANGTKTSQYIIDDTSYIQQYEYIPAIIIKSTHHKVNNYFTLNIGSEHGVERDMGVISDKGVIGVIHSTSKYFSVVKSVLTEAINIDIMIEKSGQFGLLKWNGRDPRYGMMYGVSNDTDIKLWSKVVTRGGGGMFPRGLPVGKISKSETIEGQPLWDLTLQFSEDYRTVQNVYVIKNLLKAEQQELENQTAENNQ